MIAERMSAARALDYIDARQMAKAMARWYVAGDLPDERLQEDSVACRYLNRRIAELTEDYVPYAVAAIKALGAEPVDAATLQREAEAERARADAMREALEGLVAAVVKDSNEHGISGYTGARLSDARAALSQARGEPSLSSEGK